MHYYQHNIGDYRKDTGHLSATEHGIYRQLLDWYYLDEKPIPKETQVVIRRLRLASDSDLQALKNVLSDFFVLQDDGYHQMRCDYEIKQYQHNAEKNRANGKLGGRPKKTQSVILANPNETESKGNQEPVTINHKPKKEKATVVAAPEGVSEEVWDSFVKQRKTARAVITPVVINSIAEQAKLAGWTLEKALSECAARGWRGFKAEWVAPKQSFAQQAADVARTTVPAQHTGPDPVLLQILADRQKSSPMPEHIRKQINQVLRKA